LRCLEVIVIGDVGNADDQNPHPSMGTVNDARRNMNERTLGNWLLDTIKDNATTAIQHVVKFCGTLVIMELASVNVDDMHPSRRRKMRILAADKAITPAAATTLSRCVALMANKERSWKRRW
jgi:hypothetical protein